MDKFNIFRAKQEELEKTLKRSEATVKMFFCQFDEVVAEKDKFIARIVL